MTKNDAAMHIELIKAFAEGKTIQLFKPYLDRWEDVAEPKWTAGYGQYRIKPEPTYVPFTFDDRELFRGKWVRSKESGNELQISTITKSGVNSFNTMIQLYSDAFTNWEFLDGTPFGKLKV